MTTLHKEKYLLWRTGWVGQHQPSRIAKSITGVFDFKEVKHGDVKKNQGDVVIIGLGTNPYVSFAEYMNYFYGVDRIETQGIYTNVFWSRKFFTEAIKHIAKDL